MIGTRGVPAAYGGFETAIDEIGRRLVARGHRVTVYCRFAPGEKKRTHAGMRLVHLPALRVKVAETLSHTALSIVHTLVGRKTDAAFVFNAANSPFLPLLRFRRIPVALHMDGLEWKRGKWGPTGQKYYRLAEQLGVRWADSLIADAQGIADYYRREFDVPTELLTYGAPIIDDPHADRLAELGLEPGRFSLVVARFEPENHVDVIVEGYRKSASTLPLVVVGSAPYAEEYTAKIARLAEGDDRIRLVGGIWDQELLDELYSNAATYIHGHSVGGTNPSLLRAMGAGAAVLAFDVDFNREVLGGHGRFFSLPEDVAHEIDTSDSGSGASSDAGARLRERARSVYDWDRVTDGYEALARKIAAGATTRGSSTGARQRSRTLRSNLTRTP
ncbi:DUF1972 domain-containing protein [Marisediminicola sp. LYQ134]|uniref:DUF1972 domain-containing protein n=1 Tax=Marisediminicola sp. LYQ134 TaxID=3391061 RepID=UPI003982F9FC